MNIRNIDDAELKYVILMNLVTFVAAFMIKKFQFYNLVEYLFSVCLFIFIIVGSLFLKYKVSIIGICTCFILYAISYIAGIYIFVFGKPIALILAILLELLIFVIIIVFIYRTIQIIKQMRR